MSKLCQTLMANLLLRRYIEVLIILKLELLEKLDTEEPFLAQIIIGFEPTSIIDFFGLFKPSAVIDANPLQGMLQIHQIFPEHVDFGGFSKAAPFPKCELEKRQVISCSSGLGARPFGVIQFIHGSGKKSRLVVWICLYRKQVWSSLGKGTNLRFPLTLKVERRSKSRSRNGHALSSCTYFKSSFFTVMLIRRAAD
jgi:hypothetical protein